MRYHFTPVRKAAIQKHKFMVAVDKTISAGIGEDVLVVTGSSARVAVGCEYAPVDAVIVGVIDKPAD